MSKYATLSDITQTIIDDIMQSNLPALSQLTNEEIKAYTAAYCKRICKGAEHIINDIQISGDTIKVDLTVMPIKPAKVIKIDFVVSPEKDVRIARLDVNADVTRLDPL